jgi:hypothetical protein
MKEVIVMHYLMDEPVPKVAKFLCQPVTTVKWRLHCARKALAAKLGAAAKKPGLKVLLIALVLAALTAIGAAVVTAVGTLPRSVRDAVSAEESSAASPPIDGDRLQSAAIDGYRNPSATDSRLQPATDNSPTAQLSNSPTNQLQPAQGETMNATTRKAALGAATALALAAAPPAATANNNLGTSEWDGQSWVYDTSRHVAAQPSTGASPSVALAASRDSGVSADGPLDAVFVTRQMSNGSPINGGTPAFTLIIR